MDSACAESSSLAAAVCSAWAAVRCVACFHLRECLSDLLDAARLFLAPQMYLFDEHVHLFATTVMSVMAFTTCSSCALPSLDLAMDSSISVALPEDNDAVGILVIRQVLSVHCGVSTASIGSARHIQVVIAAAS